MAFAMRDFLPFSVHFILNKIKVKKYFHETGDAAMLMLFICIYTMVIFSFV
jgi:hypothetical protein